jgi:hypothetical protein
MAKKTRKSGISAKVEAVAKATYQRKRTTTEIVPPDVTRAKAGAWLDLISPLTEWAGLKGDELRFKRAQLRLQREDVLLDIVTRARAKIQNRETIERPLPNKFLVPFLEQASLEDPDGVLVEMWASLLASAITDFNSHHIHFVSIMSQLSPKQGELLRLLVGTDSPHQFDFARDNIQMFYQSHHIREEIVSAARDLSEKHDAAFVDMLKNAFNSPCVQPVHIFVDNRFTDKTISVDVDYFDSDEVDYSILEAVGLIRRVDTGPFEAECWSVLLIYYHLTELGHYFCPAVGMVLPSTGIPKAGDVPRTGQGAT